MLNLKGCNDQVQVIILIGCFVDIKLTTSNTGTLSIPHPDQVVFTTHIVEFVPFRPLNFTSPFARAHNYPPKSTTAYQQ